MLYSSTFLTALNILILRKECLIAVGTQLQCGSLIYQHEAEHHLDCQKQRMKVPNHSGPISQLNMVFRRNALNRCPTGPLNFPGLFFHLIIVFVIEEAAYDGFRMEQVTANLTEMTDFLY